MCVGILMGLKQIQIQNEINVTGIKVGYNFAKNNSRSKYDNVRKKLKINIPISGGVHVPTLFLPRLRFRRVGQ